MATRPYDKNGKSGSNWQSVALEMSVIAYRVASRFAQATATVAAAAPSWVALYYQGAAFASRLAWALTEGETENVVAYFIYATYECNNMSAPGLPTTLPYVFDVENAVEATFFTFCVLSKWF